MADEQLTAGAHYILTGDSKALKKALSEARFALSLVKKDGIAAEKQLAAMTKESTKTGAALKSGLVAGAKAGASALAALGAAALASMKQTMDYRAEVVRLTEATGLQASTVTGAAEAVRRYGGDSAQVIDQLQDFTEKLYDFSQGGGEAEESLLALGIKQEDVANGTLSADAALRQVLTRLPKWSNEVERGAFSQQLFSDRGLDLTNALRNMPIEEATRLAEAYGRSVNEDAVTATKAWQTASADLTGAITGLGSSFLDFIDYGRRATDFLTGAVAINAAFAESFRQVTEDTDGLIAGLARLIFGMQDFGLIGQAASDAAVSFQHARQSTEESAEALEDWGEDSGPVVTQAERLKQAQDKYNKSLRDGAKASKDSAAAMGTLRQAGVDAGSDLVSESENIRIEYERQIRTLEELAESGSLTADQRAESEIQIAEVTARMNRDIEDSERARIEATLEGYSEEQEAARDAAEVKMQAQQDWEDMHEASLERATQDAEDWQKDQAEAYRAVAASAVGSLSDIARAQGTMLEKQLGESRDQQSAEAEGYEAAADARRDQIKRLRSELDKASGARKDSIRAELQVLRKKAKSERKLGRKSMEFEQEQFRTQRKEIKKQLRTNFAAQKAAALSEILINTARAVMMANTIPPPAGQILAGALGAAGLAQGAIVAAEQPSFHLGTDEVQATLRNGEAVLTPSAAEAMGRDNIRSANAGQSPAGPGGATTINFIWKGRVIDRLVADVINAGGAASSAVQSIARNASPASSGTYGGR